MNLLIVEDEARMAELLRRGLGEEGHAFMSAPDGVEGLDLARTYHFDVILLDVMMPGLDGFQMVHRLRKEKIKTPVLILTARDTVPDIVRGLDLGADDYMTKPFSFDELVARLRANMIRGVKFASIPVSDQDQLRRHIGQTAILGRSENR